MLLFNIFPNIFLKKEDQAIAVHTLILILVALSLLGIRIIHVFNQIAVAL